MSTLLGDIDRARSARRQYEDDLAFADDNNNNNSGPFPPPRRRIVRRQPSRYFDPPHAASTTDANTNSSSNSSLVAARHPPAYLLEWHDDDRPPKHRHLTPTEFRDAIPLAERSSRRRLLVLQGVSPGAYLDVLRGSEALRMDDEFLEAHAAGRGYRPVGRRGSGWCCESWGYPEVVVGGGKPRVWSLGKEGLGVVFCRASLWEAPGCAPVLLLDRPAWEDEGEEVRRMERKLSLLGDAKQDEFIPCLEDLIRKGRPLQHREGHQLLLDAVFDRWLALFEHLPPPTATLRDAVIASYWQILHALEQNIATSTPLSTNFPSLLPLLQTRIALLSACPPPAGIPSLPLGHSFASTRPSAAAAARLPPPPRRTGRELLDENHRALDRISYLGGVLLPLPVVSGVLSMTDRYSPDGTRFWVFWAAAIPLSVVAVCVIYADTIRKAEVWVEVKEQVHPAAAGGAGAGGEVPTVMGRLRGLWRGRGKGAADEEDAVTVSEPAGGVVCAVPHEPRVRRPAARAGEEKAGVEGEEPQQTMFPMFLSLGPGGGGFVEVEPEPERPEMIVEEARAGRRGRAWRRKKLGWTGAAKAILYEKPRYCDKHMPKGYGGLGRAESY